MPASDRNRRVDWARPAAFLGDGRAARSIAGRDWSSTSLGRIEEWPHILKCATAFVLRSPLPMVISVTTADTLMSDLRRRIRVPPSDRGDSAGAGAEAVEPAA